jgi:hypothetical protein
MKRKFYIVVKVATMLLFAVNYALACPNCKDGYASGADGASLGDSYSISVLFMLAVPTTIVAIFGLVLARKVKQNRNS